VIIPLLDEHRFSPYVRAVLRSALMGNIPREMPKVPKIAPSQEKNTCLAVERELLARIRECAQRLGLPLNHFLRALLFCWEAEEVKLRVPPEQYFRAA
jgi:hypothetical protein